MPAPVAGRVSAGLPPPVFVWLVREGHLNAAIGLLDLAARCGYDEELAWLDEMMQRWPVRMDGRLAPWDRRDQDAAGQDSRTDATPDKYVVTYQGDGLDPTPLRGLPGLTFPFRAPATLQITGAGPSGNGLENPIVVEDESIRVPEHVRLLPGQRLSLLGMPWTLLIAAHRRTPLVCDAYWPPEASFVPGGQATCARPRLRHTVCPRPEDR